MTADRWTHHDPAVRKLIREAQVEVWDEAHLAMCDDMSNWGRCHLNPGYRHANPYRVASAPTEDANVAHAGSVDVSDAFEGAADHHRAQYDPMSGRIDNWSER